MNKQFPNRVLDGYNTFYALYNIVLFSYITSDIMAKHLTIICCICLWLIAFVHPVSLLIIIPISWKADQNKENLEMRQVAQDKNGEDLVYNLLRAY